MPREYKTYLDDISEAIYKIEEYTKGVSYEEFKEKEIIQDEERLREDEG